MECSTARQSALQFRQCKQGQCNYDTGQVVQSEFWRFTATDGSSGLPVPPKFNISFAADRQQRQGFIRECFPAVHADLDGEQSDTVNPDTFKRTEQQR